MKDLFWNELLGEFAAPAFETPQMPLRTRKSTYVGMSGRRETEWLVIDADGKPVCSCEDQRVAIWISAGMPESSKEVKR